MEQMTEFRTSPLPIEIEQIPSAGLDKQVYIM